MPQLRSAPSAVFATPGLQNFPAAPTATPASASASVKALYSGGKNGL